MNYSPKNYNGLRKSLTRGTDFIIERARSLTPIRSNDYTHLDHKTGVENLSVTNELRVGFENFLFLLKNHCAISESPDPFSFHS